MINTLILGTKTFPVNLIQGPLAGISCAPFRILSWRYSQPAFTCTEMISSKTLLYQSKFYNRRFTHIDAQEGPVCFQLASNNPLELAEATKRVTDYGAALIDLNCGCPVPKIRNKGAGSSLLMNPKKLYQLIVAMKQNTHLPVSIKIRVQGKAQDKFNLEIAQVVHDAGADFLIVHGRHWTEHYETPCRYEDIQFFVEQLTIPVIGNGDVGCADSLKRMLATGCAGVMLARATVGQPWLIQQLIASVTNQDFVRPSNQEIGKIFIEHIQQLAALLGNEKFAVLQARKMAKYYGRWLVRKVEFCNAVNVCTKLDEFIVQCVNFLA